MTRLTLAARNMLVQVPEVKAMVSDTRIGSGSTWTDGWIFSDKPHANIEKRSHMALVVITEAPWQPPNTHNTMQFRLLLVDIWASPTRQPDGSPRKDDADNLIEEVFAAVRPYLHTVEMGVPGNSDLDPTLSYLGRPGHPRFWGTEQEIANHTGVLIIASEHNGGPIFSDVRDGNGARMGRYQIGVTTA